ncbi:pyridoxamine 5'-phosphate oxidase family protein [Nocardia sp. NPDC050378]|uniref:pyridoxamine 5'-phosphate oxidase family protein n=1 Tax=Nocardia sp. NPDC050378 TaxID=3155400 RepID=UPI0033E2A3E5
MPKLKQHELEEYLAEPGRYARFATVDDDGYPRVIPISFLFHNGTIQFTLRPNSAPWSNVRRDPRISIALDEMEDPMRRVIIQGIARVVHEPGSEDQWEDLHRQMLLKTRPADEVEEYLRAMAEAGVERPWLAVDLDAPTRVKSWRSFHAGEARDRLVPYAQQYLKS